MSDVDESAFFLTTLRFLQRFRYLFDFKLTEFFIHKPYEKLPLTWIDYLSSNLATADAVSREDECESCVEENVQFFQPDVRRLFLSMGTMPVDLHRFIVDAINLSLSRVPWEADFSYPEIPMASSRGLSPKKEHEITRLAAFLHDLAWRQMQVKGKAAADVVFVDVGSGLGYLGEILSVYGYNVINVESEQSHCEGAKRRQAKNDSNLEPDSRININATLADDATSISAFNALIWDCVSNRLSKDPTQTIAILTGLHACGDLTPTMLKVFNQDFENPIPQKINYHAIAVVGCCYHRMSPLLSRNEGIERHFPLSHALGSAFASFGESSEDATDSHPSEFLGSFALRLGAQETLSRWRRQTLLDHERHSRHVAYRGILEAALHSMRENGDRKNRNDCGDGNRSNDIEGIEKLHKKLVSGKSASFVDFDAYKASLFPRVTIKSAQKKDVDEERNWEEVLSSVLDEKYQQLKLCSRYVEPITFLQFLLQGVIERLILEDRAAFLRERGFRECKLVPLFEDHISPRNVAIVASRS